MDDKQALHWKDGDRLVDGGELVEDRERREPSVRSLLTGFLLVLSGLYYISIGTTPYPGRTVQHSQMTIHARTARVLEQNPLIDGHDDLLILLRFAYQSKIYSSNFTTGFEDGGAIGMVDIPRLETGKQGGAFWSAFVPCPADPLDFSDEAYAPYVKMTLEQIDLFNRLGEKYPKYFTLPTDADEAVDAWLEDGRLVSPLGIEGLHQIGNSLSTLRLYRQLGVRYATLTWNCHNRYADAAVTPNEDGETAIAEPYHHGISAAGQDLILEMNRIGMLVDLSHVSVDTMRDALQGKGDWQGSIAPPIFSHSSAKAICPHPRNVPDDILQLVKKRRSVVMVNFSPDFVSCQAGNASTGLPDFVEETNTLEHVVEHVTYIGDLIGYDHVGLGTDFDGIPAGPRGLEDVSKFPDLVEELLRRGVSEEDAGKVVGRNILRVWREAEVVATRLQKSMDPVEDEIESPW